MRIAIVMCVVLAAQACEAVGGGGRSRGDATTDDLACDVPAAHLPGAVCDAELNVVWLEGGDDPECLEVSARVQPALTVLADRCRPYICMDKATDSGDGGCSKDGATCAPSCAVDADCPADHYCLVP